MSTMQEAVAVLESGGIEGIIHLREDFSRQLRGSGGAPIQVIVNGTDANNARLITGYIEKRGANGLNTGQKRAAPP